MISIISGGKDRAVSHKLSSYPVQFLLRNKFLLEVPSNCSKNFDGLFSSPQFLQRLSHGGDSKALAVENLSVTSGTTPVSANHHLLLSWKELFKRQYSETLVCSQRAYRIPGTRLQPLCRLKISEPREGFELKHSDLTCHSEQPLSERYPKSKERQAQSIYKVWGGNRASFEPRPEHIYHRHNPRRISVAEISADFRV